MIIKTIKNVFPNSVQLSHIIIQMNISISDNINTAKAEALQVITQSLLLYSIFNELLFEI